MIKSSVLFISHDVSRTGAPAVLLHLLQWLENTNLDWNMDLATLSGGDLEPEFRRSVRQFFDLSYKPGKDATIPPISERIRNKLIRSKPRNASLASAKDTIFQHQYEIVFANTVVSLEFAVAYKKQHPKCRLILHVHELDPSIRCMVPNFTELSVYVDQFIAVSRLVKSNLTENYGISNERIRIIYASSRVQNHEYKSTRNPNKKFCVGAAGMVHARKGDDVFLQVARYVSKHYSELNIEFVWVGGISEIQRTVLHSDLKKLGLEQQVRFVGQQQNPFPFFQDFDLFFLSSREDPFPLVCIEVGMMGKPILCFESATGTAEILAQGGGVILPYLDVEAVAQSIVDYYHSPEKIQRDGAQNKMQFAQFAPSQICPQIASCIQSQLNQ